ncbi:Cell adhesion molecule 2 [Pseudolycoriella hygida]|uniref:Cell adhesion molecule 2 n=1 Tax=Pseudolycoriella hygida TaxID=35572 RepID=A0A9Q0SAG8_9DIPT|nr:Cell adhesion molecule 2 [Pseudolycoriella hygida]
MLERFFPLCSERQITNLAWSFVIDIFAHIGEKFLCGGVLVNKSFENTQNCIQILLTCTLTVNGLRDVRVTVPAAVKRGDNAELICLYDMEGDSLYSVKWYKGRREFYRYTPKENPAMKTFVVNGINVERSLSDETRLTLSSVQPSVSGKYSCEVSADAPSFHTLIESGDLEVVEVPEHRPFIVGIRSRYRVGDSLRANCTSKHSKPAANLTWIVNDLPIRCVSKIHDIYFQKTERTIEHERPKPSASASNSVNNVNNPYDQYVPQDEVLDKQDLYMTQTQGVVLLIAP